ncbi:RNA-binding (RRM/RBD/RNP motif) family protein isoform 1 [Dorcoceras hygrometricum]|uniref:RNA-binding (RRM/RBD/RNP motif) family protein isoform 1 n=1 Tax=Dorcoceras hygrometricum TaxID=472368 RepID=A0A2Z7BFI7_9LAMI|nr:RNA-binding (RRM/RBD/RNP motif) family protein isoform 1 [Dorcoceras hygrometricum]
MGVKAKKKMVSKNMKKVSADILASKKETRDFLPLEGRQARGDIMKVEDKENKATVLYIGRIPHGFYENEMEGFFKQFGSVKRLRIARNRKTGRSKHFGFIEFESPEVAKVVADCMHNYLMYEHLLQVSLVPPERVHPQLWKVGNHSYKPLDWVQIERKRQDKEKTFEQQQKSVARILKRDQKRRKRIEAAGIDYECPEIVVGIQSVPKKIRFESE